MGRDLLPRAVTASASRDLLAPGESTVQFTFMVEKHDGSQDEIDSEMSPAVADLVWRILDIRRE